MENENGEKEHYDRLCFWLGFFLTIPFGLLIAAIVDGGRGVLKAIKGMVVMAFLVLVLLLLSSL